MFRHPHLFGALLIVGAVPFFLACDDGPAEPVIGQPSKESVVIPGSVTLEVGQSVWLTVAPADLEAGKRGVQWVSSNPDVAYVSHRGVVQARSEGSAIITADCGLFCLSATVTVIKATG